MKLTKKQQELLSRTAGRLYSITKFEGRSSPDHLWRAHPLRGNQILPRQWVTFVREDKKPYAVLMVIQTVNGTKCDCESMAPAAEIAHNENFSEIVLTGPYGRLTYTEIK